MPLFDNKTVDNKFPLLIDYIVAFMKDELQEPIEKFLPKNLYRVAITLIHDWKRVIEKAQACTLAFMIGEPVRPSNWNLWGEVTHYDLRTGSYIGDMPHTWVGAGFCNAVRSMFVYEEDSHVVIGGGITDKWINDTVTVLNMPTWFGKVSYTISKNELEEVSMKLSGTANPKGGFIIRLPYGEDTAVKINGKDVVKSGRDIIYYGRLPVAIELKMK